MTLFTPHQIRRGIRWLVVAGSLGLGGWIISSAVVAMIPFLVGSIIAYLALPLVRRLEQWLPCWLAILVVYLGVLGGIGAAIVIVVPPLIAQIIESVHTLPDRATLQHEAHRFADTYEQVLASVPVSVQATIRTIVTTAITESIHALIALCVDIADGIDQDVAMFLRWIVHGGFFLLGFLLIPSWLFYVLMDVHTGWTSITTMIPPHVRTDVRAMLLIVDHDLTVYLRSRLLRSISVGLAMWIGLTALTMAGMTIPVPILLAIVAGIAEVVPIIGPILGAIPAIVLGLLDSPITALAVIILVIAIQYLEHYLFVPRIIGERVDVHPAILMLVIVMSTQVFGLVGALIAPPLSAIARDLFLYLYERLRDPVNPPKRIPLRLRRVIDPVHHASHGPETDAADDRTTTQA